VVIGVGATIDFLAGRVKRAPHWMHRAGLEWIYRLSQEPRRLFRRYATDLWEFGWAMGAQWWRTGVCFQQKCLKPAPPRIRLESKWERIELPERFDAGVVQAHAQIWDQIDRHCLLDAGQVRFIDSTGVGLLLYLRRRLSETGRGLVLLAPSRAVRKVLEGMRVQDLFVTTSNVLDARRIAGSAVAERSPALTKARRARTTPRIFSRRGNPFREIA
jgi:N-acetylglucosaminyldiphosphoundecaprenol N-acetyl-beta-D-mannosaminyltransferase